MCAGGDNRTPILLRRRATFWPHIAGEIGDELQRPGEETRQLRSFTEGRNAPRRHAAGLGTAGATTRPAAIRLNYGIQRSERGGAATRAVAALPALVGSWREVGGGLQLSTSQAFRLNRTALEMPELQRRSPLGRDARVVNMTELGKALTQLNDPPVKAMVVYNSNPASIAPNQNLVFDMTLLKVQRAQ